jgi:hypothetical protein
VICLAENLIITTLLECKASALPLTINFDARSVALPRLGANK